MGLHLDLLYITAGLVEAVEESGLVYAYGENYCYMSTTYEMKKLYESGEIGEFEYGEGEYIHNCESIWPSITYGEPDHWRNGGYETGSLRSYKPDQGMREQAEGTYRQAALTQGSKQ